MRSMKMEAKNKTTKILLFLVGIAVVNSSELVADTLLIPLLGRDPYKVMNFHDVCKETDVVHGFLDASGGRLGTNDAILYFSSVRHKSIIARITSDSVKSGKIRVSILNKIYPTNEDGSLDVKHSINEISIKNVDSTRANYFIKLSKWFSSNKFDSKIDIARDKSMLPNFQLYVITSDGLCLLDHTIKGALSQMYLDAAICIFSSQSTSQENFFEAFNSNADRLKFVATREYLNNLKENPARSMKYATLGDETGETERTISDKIISK